LLAVLVLMLAAALEPVWELVLVAVMVRLLATALEPALLVAVLVLMAFGGEVNRDFTITLVFGIIVGTYSSIFIASPVLYLGHQRAAEKEKS